LIAECGVPTAMTEEEKIEMVKLHNEDRSIDGANEFALVSPPIQNVIT